MCARRTCTSKPRRSRGSRATGAAGMTPPVTARRCASSSGWRRAIAASGFSSWLRTAATAGRGRTAGSARPRGTSGETETGVALASLCECASGHNETATYSRQAKPARSHDPACRLHLDSVREAAQTERGVACCGIHSSEPPPSSLSRPVAVNARVARMRHPSHSQLGTTAQQAGAPRPVQEAPTDQRRPLPDGAVPRVLQDHQLRPR